MAHAEIDATDIGDGPNRYGPTAARRHGAARARIAAPTVDVHSHVIVRDAQDFAAPFFSLDQVPLERFNGEQSRQINQAQFADRLVAFTDPDDRIRALDAMGIDRQIVESDPVQCYYEIDRRQALAAARRVNDGLAAFVSAHPERLFALGTVPLQDPDAMLPEFRRIMRDLGFKGVQILPEVGQVELSDPSLEPFWAAAEDFGAVVMIHPVGYTGGQRFGSYYFSNVIGNPLGTTVALHHIIFGGVLERHPRLKILVVHGGGFLPAYAGRIDHAWGARRDARGDLPNPPSQYLAKIYFDSIVFTPHQLAYLVEQYGADHVLMGTDYPADMAEYRPVEHILDTPGLTEAERATIAGGAAARLFGL